jgi:hypothetical protein
MLPDGERVHTPLSRREMTLFRRPGGDLLVRHAYISGAANRTIVLASPILGGAGCFLARHQRIVQIAMLSRCVKRLEASRKTRKEEQ